MCVVILSPQKACTRMHTQNGSATKITSIELRMNERLLVLEAQRDGKVVLSTGRTPPGLPIEQAGSVPALQTRGRRIRVPEWVVGATATICNSLMTGEPPGDAAKWWAKVAELSTDEAEELRNVYAKSLKESKEACASRTDLKTSLLTAEGAMVQYGEALVALTTACASSLRAAAESCERATTSLREDTLAIEAAAEQLHHAADAPLPPNAESEWRSRIREILEVEIDHAHKRTRDRATSTCEAIRDAPTPSIPSSLVNDPSTQFYSTPLISTIVNSYCRQVELHMVEKLRDVAETCAPFLNKGILQGY